MKITAFGSLSRLCDRNLASQGCSGHATNIAPERLRGWAAQYRGSRYHQKGMLFDKLQQAFDDYIQDKTVALRGLAFKLNTGDMREVFNEVLMKALWVDAPRLNPSIRSIG